MADTTSSNEIEIASKCDKEVVTATPEAVENGTAEKSKTNGNHAAEDCKPGTSSGSPTKADSDVVKEAMQHLAAGKRNLLVQDLTAAVSSLGQACEMLGKHFGETAKECGEPYFLYGKALLDLARAEAGVIDNGLEGVPDEEDADNSQVEDPEKCSQEEVKEIVEKVGEALEENFAHLEKLKAEKAKTEKPATNGDAEPSNGTNGDVEMAEAKKADESEANSTEEEGDDDDEAGDDEPAADNEAEAAVEGEEDEPRAKEDTESIGSNEAGPSSAKDTKDVSAIEAEEEEDPSNLQLAWEMFELAKTIFTKHIESLEAESPIKSELEAKLSETYQFLGEVSIENEDYKQAIEDLTTCLKRRQKLLPEDSRCIAETHYQLGVALGFNLQFDEAVCALNDAIGVLQTRIELLKTEKESKDATKADDAFYTREREIAEIEGLIPEIREKIADTNDMKEETFKKLGDKRMFEEGLKSDGASTESAAASSSDITPSTNGEPSKAASSISHLVKKRKKSDDATEASTNGETNGDAAKKPHIEGEAVATNGHTNGN